ncbi:hypothetical protein Pth03_07090 [Planotetraspora thailandica]|uniref:Uncharacterized protein n=1 Tax=Planotetraspora thailandica TaxID=487172 RepID=A0A8J3V944_9ACTN|nr:hypothetical protein Pth03_07090 [Planotetraspora thailandica]
MVSFHDTEPDMAPEPAKTLTGVAAIRALLDNVSATESAKGDTPIKTAKAGRIEHGDVRSRSWIAPRVIATMRTRMINEEL